MPSTRLTWIKDQPTGSYLVGLDWRRPPPATPRARDRSGSDSAHQKNSGLKTLTTPHQNNHHTHGKWQQHVHPQIGESSCRNIQVTNASEKMVPSEWSNPMWMKNIIPNEVWTNEASSFGPIPLKLGYHQSVVAYYNLQTTRGLP